MKKFHKEHGKYSKERSQTKNVLNHYHWSLMNRQWKLEKGHMVNRILHSWSFHMKFIKLAEGSFHKFHMKCPLVLQSLRGFLWTWEVQRNLFHKSLETYLGYKKIEGD